MNSTILLIIILIIIVVIIIKCMARVPEDYEFVVERKGQFNRILSQGVHFLAPFQDKIVSRCSLEEHRIELMPIDVKTEDGRTVGIGSAVVVKISNAKTFFYGQEDLTSVVSQSVTKVLRETAGTIPVANLKNSQAYIEKHVQRTVNRITMAAGVMTIFFEITDIKA